MRERMVTRTINATVATVLCMDIVNASATTKEIEISGTYKDDSDLLKVLKKKYDTTDFVVVAIQKTETKEKLYGMTETDFMKYAKEMESRFDKI